MNNNEELVEQFNSDMKNLCRKSKEEIDYTPTYFIQMINEGSGLSAVQRLLKKKEWTDGLTILWEKDRWDLTVESYVLMPKYKQLFSEEEIKICEERKDAFKK